MRLFATLGLAFALGTGAVLPSFAAEDDELLDASSIERLQSILKGFGSARLDIDSDGDPMISGRSDGKQYTLFFYGCTEGRNCRSVQFWAYWDEQAPLETVNEWNKGARYGRLYNDKDDDLVLEFDVNLSHGISERTMEENAEIWVGLMSRVARDVLPQIENDIPPQ